MKKLIAKLNLLILDLSFTDIHADKVRRLSFKFSPFYFQAGRMDNGDLYATIGFIHINYIVRSVAVFYGMERAK